MRFEKTKFEDLISKKCKFDVWYDTKVICKTRLFDTEVTNVSQFGWSSMGELSND